MCGRFLSKLPAAETALIFGTRNPDALCRALPDRADGVLAVRFNTKSNEHAPDALRPAWVRFWAKDMKIGSKKDQGPRVDGGAGAGVPRWPSQSSALGLARSV
jgi:hypothetical protein